MRRTAFFTVVCILQASPALAAPHGVGASLWIDAEGSYMPNNSGDAPSFSISGDSNTARSVINGSTPRFGFPMGFLGTRAGMDLVLGDRWILPLMDVGIFGIIGSYSDAITSADGTYFKVSTNNSILLDTEVFGFGVRFKRRRWMFSFTIKPGVAFLITPAGVADGKSFTDVDALTSVSPTLRANLEVCRRLDPEQRLCLGIQPNIYAWGWGNGGSLALRWELGP